MTSKDLTTLGSKRLAGTSEMEPVAPILPPDVDLSDFGYMPLDVRRLRDSRLAATASGDEFRAAVLLWCASWHQVPAASLPDDDVELSQLAGYGRVIKEWKKVREGALHGWIKCRDGRLYYPVVAEKAASAWNEKRDYAWAKECDRIRKENKKRENSGVVPLEFPERPRRISCGDGEGIPEERGGVSGGIPSENALKGEGKGKGKGKEERKKDIPTTSDALGASGDDHPKQLPSARDEVWSSGLPIIRRLTGKSEAQCRGFLGRLLKSARDDCARVLALLREAEDLRPVDPQAWLSAAADRGAQGPPSKLAYLADFLSPQSPPQPGFDLELTPDEHGTFAAH